MNRRLFVLAPDVEAATAWARKQRLQRTTPVDAIGSVFRGQSNPAVAVLPGWRDYRTREECRQLSETMRDLGASLIPFDDTRALAEWQPNTR